MVPSKPKLIGWLCFLGVGIRYQDFESNELYVIHSICDIRVHGSKGICARRGKGLLKIRQGN